MKTQKIKMLVDTSVKGKTALTGSVIDCDAKDARFLTAMKFGVAVEEKAKAKSK